MQILLLIIVAGLVLYNLAIHSSILFKISAYCLQTNTLDQYWTTFFKVGVSAKAIISSAIAIALALAVFILITPIVLIRKALFNNKIKETLENGYFFEYPDYEPVNKEETFTSNLDEVNLEGVTTTITGRLRIDALMLISEMDKAMKEQGREFAYEVMQEQQLAKGKKAVIPMLLTIDGKKYPAYPLYNETHKQQYRRVRSALYDAGFTQTLYFSVGTFEEVYADVV